MSTAKFDNWLNSDGTTNYKCRAWVNFNGTGTVAIRASGNVSSITDNGVGDYTVNFTTAMPDANYSVAGGCLNTTYSTNADTPWRGILPKTGTLLAGSVNVLTKYVNSGGGAVEDENNVFVQIIR